MGLHLNYEFHLPDKTSSHEVDQLLAALHAHARTLQIDEISEVASLEGVNNLPIVGTILEGVMIDEDSVDEFLNLSRGHDVPLDNDQIREVWNTPPFDATITSGNASNHDSIGWLQFWASIVALRSDEPAPFRIGDIGTTRGFKVDTGDGCETARNSLLGNPRGGTSDQRNYSHESHSRRICRAPCRRHGFRTYRGSFHFRPRGL